MCPCIGSGSLSGDMTSCFKVTIYKGIWLGNYKINFGVGKEKLTRAWFEPATFRGLIQPTLMSCVGCCCVIQAYIRMDCKGGNPDSAPRSRWQRPMEKTQIVAHTLKWPSGLVCLATCIKKIVSSKMKNILRNSLQFSMLWQIFEGWPVSLTPPPKVLKNLWRTLQPL